MGCLGWGVYSNKRQIDKIKKNIRKLQDQNILQAKQIDELARYMNLTMERVRQHDQKLYELEVELVQLRSSLVSLSYDLITLLSSIIYSETLRLLYID